VSVTVADPDVRFSADASANADAAIAASSTRPTAW